MRILLAEDDPDLSRQLKRALADADYAVDHAADGEEAHFLGDTEPYDAVILDLGLPKIDGVSVLERWRRDGKSTPVLILTARGAWSDKVTGFDAGADDYLTKPFSLPELLARIRVARRHTAPGEKGESLFAFGDLRVDLASRVVTRDGQDVHLTPVEYKLLAALVRNAGRVMTYQQLLEDVWGLRSLAQKQYLHVYVGHLRAKLEVDPARPRFLLTESGVGYRLKIG